MTPNPRPRRWRRIGLWVLIMLAVGLVADYWAFPYGALPGGRSGDVGANGLWLRYRWAAGERSDADLRELVARLRKEHIRYAYFHVRGAKADGSLRHPDFEQYRTFVGQFRELAPNVAPIAWFSPTNAKAGGSVDLSRPGVRGNLVSAAERLVKECGFAGVQWDYEACPSGNLPFVSLLQESRVRLPKDAIISVAAPIWEPWFLPSSGWSAAYFTMVAALCDQIAVMGYDTGAYFPRTYVWLMARQVVEVSKAIGEAGGKCRLLIGVPTYGAGLLSHNRRAENIELALRGVREGLAMPETRGDVFSGVAIFADYTTDDKEWAAYERMWRDPKLH